MEYRRKAFGLSFRFGIAAFGLGLFFLMMAVRRKKM
jgi:hypothetical protein